MHPHGRARRRRFDCPPGFAWSWRSRAGWLRRRRREQQSGTRPWSHPEGLRRSGSALHRVDLLDRYAADLPKRWLLRDRCVVVVECARARCTLAAMPDPRRQTRTAGSDRDRPARQPVVVAEALAPCWLSRLRSQEPNRRSVRRRSCTRSGRGTDTARLTHRPRSAQGRRPGRRGAAGRQHIVRPRSSGSIEHAWWLRVRRSSIE